MPSAERAELLAVLAEDNDTVVREQATEALLGQPITAIVEALGRDSPSAALYRYCGHHLVGKPEVALALAKQTRCPAQFLPAIARSLSPAGVQELFNDLNPLSLSTNLASALLHSAALAPEQREQLRELLEEDLQRRFVSEEDLADIPSAEKRVTLLQRLSKMRVVERVQMALKGNREERLALIRDPCKVVQRAVLQSPRLTEREVESFAAMANLSEDVLRLIARNRNFAGNPIVVRNLMNNPKTPLDISLHFLPNIGPQDLKSLTLNHNIPETLRTLALRLHRQRAMQRA